MIEAWLLIYQAQRVPSSSNTQPKTIPETKSSDDVTDLNIKGTGFFNQGKYQEAME